MPAWEAYQRAPWHPMGGGIDWAALNAELADDFPDLAERRSVRACIRAAEAAARAVHDEHRARRAEREARRAPH